MIYGLIVTIVTVKFNKGVWLHLHASYCCLWLGPHDSRCALSGDTVFTPCFQVKFSAVFVSKAVSCF